MVQYLEAFANIFYNILSLMSSWYIVDGVSVLGFIIALSCMSIIFGAILYRV